MGLSPFTKPVMGHVRSSFPVKMVDGFGLASWAKLVKFLQPRSGTSATLLQESGRNSRFSPIGIVCCLPAPCFIPICLSPLERTSISPIVTDSLQNHQGTMKSIHFSKWKLCMLSPTNFWPSGLARFLLRLRLARTSGPLRGDAPQLRCKPGKLSKGPMNMG